MNSDILALKEKLDKIKNLGWIECKNKNKSVTGKTLENLLEINPDNFEIPDYNTIEIKSKVSKRENYIDLFCATPDSYVLETKRLYDKYVEADGVNKADTYSARPGFSDHQTGLAIDVDNTTSSFENFTNTKEYQWMLDNSYKYGFILRYPSAKESITTYQFESWHYRYVGLKLAKKIKASNLTFDEYFTRYLALS